MFNSVWNRQNLVVFFVLDSQCFTLSFALFYWMQTIHLRYFKVKLVDHTGGISLAPFPFKVWTRMYSSRMRTLRCNCHFSCHAHPPLPSMPPSLTMHTPTMHAPCHAHPSAMHAPLPHMPPCHTHPSTRHAPCHICPLLPHMPPPAMHSPCHAHPLPCTPPCGQNS